MPRQKKPRGRPSKLVMPTRIDGVTPEQVAETVLKAKPKKVWRYEEGYKRKHGTLPK